jgi:hypothetical protein
VDLDVDEMADDLWAEHPATAGPAAAGSNISSNIGPESAEAAGGPDALTPILEGGCYPK